MHLLPKISLDNIVKINIKIVVFNVFCSLSLLIYFI